MNVVLINQKRNCNGSRSLGECVRILKAGEIHRPCLRDKTTVEHDGDTNRSRYTRNSPEV